MQNSEKYTKKDSPFKKEKNVIHYGTSPFEGSAFGMWGSKLIAITGSKWEKCREVGSKLIVFCRDKDGSGFQYMTFNGDETPIKVNKFNRFTKALITEDMVKDIPSDCIYTLYYFVWNPDSQNTLFA